MTAGNWSRLCQHTEPPEAAAGPCPAPRKAPHPPDRPGAVGGTGLVRSDMRPETGCRPGTAGSGKMLRARETRRLRCGDAGAQGPKENRRDRQSAKGLPPVEKTRPVLRLDRPCLFTSAVKASVVRRASRPVRTQSPNDRGWHRRARFPIGASAASVAARQARASARPCVTAKKRALWERVWHSAARSFR